MAPRLASARDSRAPPMARAADGIVEQAGNGVGERGGVGDIEAGFGGPEIVGNRLEIFHVGSQNHGLAEEGGLEDVVAAASGESAAHENDVGDGEEAAQLADGVEQEDVRVCVGGERGAADVRDRGVVQLSGDDVEALGLARDEDEEQPGAGKLAVGGDDGVVLVEIGGVGGRHGAGGDPDGIGAQAIDEGENGRIGVGGTGLEIVFQVSGDADTVGRGAEGGEAAGNGRRLGEDQIGLGEDGAEEPGKRR